jgi:hypothetical protein
MELVTPPLLLLVVLRKLVLMPTLVVLVLRFRKPFSVMVSPTLPPVEAVLVPLVLPFSSPVPEPLPSPAVPEAPAVEARASPKTEVMTLLPSLLLRRLPPWSLALYRLEVAAVGSVSPSVEVLVT